MIGNINLICTLIITTIVYGSMRTNKIIGAVCAVSIPIFVANIIISTKLSVYELGAFYPAVAIFWSFMNFLLSVFIIFIVEAVVD